MFFEKMVNFGKNLGFLVNLPGKCTKENVTFNLDDNREMFYTEEVQKHCEIFVKI
jgi:hypothetical protein